MKIEGAIFDLDGTIMDSMYVWDTIGADYLLSRGIQPREKLNETFKSLSLLQAAQYYQREYGLTDTADEIMAGVNRMVERFYFDIVLPKPGVVSFLKELRKRNIPMCIATATDRYQAVAALKRCGLFEYFKEIFTCKEIGSGKDNPEIFMAARQCLGTPKETTWVFEDALHAIRTAKNAGFPIVGVYDKAEEKHESEIRSSSDIYITSFYELI